jgi:predicted nucleic acid-binding protein
VILDTEFLGNIVEQQPDALAKSRDINQMAVPQHVPSAVYWELFYGLAKIADESKHRRLRTAYEKLMRSRSVLDVDESVARRAGTLRGSHERSNRTNLDGADSIVAAHGLILSEPVVSNDRDFRDVEGLTVITY